MVTHTPGPPIPPGPPPPPIPPSPPSPRLQIFLPLVRMQPTPPIPPGSPIPPPPISPRLQIFLPLVRMQPTPIPRLQIFLLRLCESESEGLNCTATQQSGYGEGVLSGARRVDTGTAASVELFGVNPNSHSSRASTTTQSVPLRPNVSGAYISSALAGGTTNVPGVVALAV